MLAFGPTKVSTKATDVSAKAKKVSHSATNVSISIHTHTESATGCSDNDYIVSKGLVKP